MNTTDDDFIITGNQNITLTSSNTAPGAGMTFNPSQNRDRNVDSGNTQITIVIEGNVLDGDDFTQKVNDALLNANRTGMPQTPAGFLID